MVKKECAELTVQITNSTMSCVALSAILHTHAWCREFVRGIPGQPTQTHDAEFDQTIMSFARLWVWCVQATMVADMCIDVN